jgi:DeoR/GlpR family transcriptional regulator of sugar metabolism
VKGYEYEKQLFIRDYLIRAMTEAGNVVSVAAQQSKVNRTYFYRLLNLYAPDLVTDPNRERRDYIRSAAYVGSEAGCVVHD